MNGIVAFALRQRFLMLALLLFVVAAGIINFTRLDIEAYPDPVPPLVEVITQAPGQSAEEIERYFTIPIEIQMAGIPHVTAVRTISLFGLSDVRVFFTYDFTYDEAEQWVINRLSQLSPLPNGASPQISPESPIGEIYRYRVVAPPGFSVTDLKTIQDWILERRFKAVPGVIDVPAGPARPRPTISPSISTNLPITASACRRCCKRSTTATSMSAGRPSISGPQAAIVRGVGLIHSMNQTSQHDAQLEQWFAGLRQGRRHRDGRPPAAARHRRSGR